MAINNTSRKADIEYHTSYYYFKDVIDINLNPKNVNFDKRS